MTDHADDRDPDRNRDRRRHQFSAGEGFDDPYDEFDLDPPELGVDPGRVDPVDSRVVADLLDERQIDRDAVDAEELVEVGLNYVGINRFEQATEAFERAAIFADEPAVEQEAWVNKGVAHAELEEWDEAVGAYREALAVEFDEGPGPPGDVREDDSRERAGEAGEHAATAATNLAYALWESGDISRALEHAERAVELDPRFPQAWYNRGFFLAERGLHEDAVRCYDNAVRLGLRNAGILEEKAHSLEALGEHEAAEQAADEAEDLRAQAEERLIEGEDRTRLRE